MKLNYNGRPDIARTIPMLEWKEGMVLHSVRVRNLAPESWAGDIICTETKLTRLQLSQEREQAFPSLLLTGYNPSKLLWKSMHSSSLLVQMFHNLLLSLELFREESVIISRFVFLF